MVIVGAGSVGSRVCEVLARRGIAVQIVDFDRVEPKNLRNQPYLPADVGLPKAAALAARLSAAHPQASIRAVCTDFRGAYAHGLIRPEGRRIILCTDTMESRASVYDVLGHKVGVYLDARVSHDGGFVVQLPPDDYARTLYTDAVADSPGCIQPERAQAAADLLCAKFFSREKGVWLC